MINKPLKLLLFILILPLICKAQFVDHFEGDQLDKTWNYYTGDGAATVEFTQHEGYARISVDATNDRHNVWWAIIKRDVSLFLDLSKLKDPAHELRVEARVRLSDAPRRLNFMVNTQRTTNFHKQLREYDISDTTGWHTISMTTSDLDAVPGDALNVQLGVTDWGLGNYHVDLDYYRAEIINVNKAEPDKGEPLVYHPPVPEIDSFSNHLEVSQDALINSDYPDLNFADWQVSGEDGTIPALTVSANQWAVLRWNFNQLKNAKADGAGVLELTTHSVARGGDYSQAYGEELGMEFGKIRVIEILAGDSDWDQQEVTYSSLLQGNKPTEVFNGQMIYDAEPANEPGGKTRITISRPVLQRLLDGETKGLLLRPLGAIDVSFYASESGEGNSGPVLHFDTRQ